MAAGRFIRASMALAFGLGLAAVGHTAARQDDRKSLNLHNINTGEDLRIVYKVGGVYDKAALEKLNWFFRDWRKKASVRMDPKVFDLLEEVYEDTGSSEPIVVHCGYRSPETNEFLRMTTPGVARESQHILGKAIDFHIPGVPLKTLRAMALKREGGGVGYYEGASTPFVHLDVGEVRYWPRASRQYLAGLFPDGKTTLIPTDGKPLPGYDEAMAELKSRQDMVLSKPGSYSARRVAQVAGVEAVPSSVPVPLSRPTAIPPTKSVPTKAAEPTYVMAYGSSAQKNVFDDPFAVIMATRRQLEAMKPTVRRVKSAAPVTPADPATFRNVRLEKTSRNAAG